MTPVVAEPAARDAVTYLSAPTPFQMADDWYPYARPEHFWFRWRFAALRALLGAPPLPTPALEVGCGNGAARTQFEQAYACAVDGCDVNAAALRQAAPGRGQLYFYNVHERRPAWCSHFASIILLDTLEHITAPVEFLRALAWHLRPGGQLILNVPAWAWLYSRYDAAQGHVKRYTARVLRTELHAAGFTLAQHGYWGLTLLPVLLARKLMLQLTPAERVVAAGFEPGSALVQGVLDTLQRGECATRVLWPVGISLVAIARREEPA
jgi:SAM-dependent methyltransferase